MTQLGDNDLEKVVGGVTIKTDLANYPTIYLTVTMEENETYEAARASFIAQMTQAAKQYNCPINPSEDDPNFLNIYNYGKENGKRAVKVPIDLTMDENTSQVTGYTVGEPIWLA